MVDLTLRGIMAIFVTKQKLWGDDIKFNFHGGDMAI
jgi:hypothetical protein